MATGVPKGEWHLLDMQDLVSASVKLKAVKSMLIDEFKSSALDNPPACAGIAAMGKQLDEALTCLGIDIANDGGTPW